MAAMTSVANDVYFSRRFLIEKKFVHKNWGKKVQRPQNKKNNNNNNTKKTLLELTLESKKKIPLPTQWRYDVQSRNNLVTRSYSQPFVKFWNFLLKLNKSINSRAKSPHI